MQAWRRIGLWIVTVGFLLLSFAALDDITTGRQPSFVLEWAMVAATAMYLMALLWRRRQSATKVALRQR